MRLDDLDVLMNMFTDTETMKYYSRLRERDETLRWIKINRESYRRRGIGKWVVVLKDTGRFAGHVGLVPQKVEGNDEVEVAYMIRRDLWGRGLASEAAFAVRDFGFRRKRLGRLVSLINPGNIASIRVAEKIGMTFERTVVKWEMTIALYSMTRRKAVRVIKLPRENH